MNRKDRRAAEKAARRKPPSKPRARFNTYEEAYQHATKPLQLMENCRPYEESDVAHDLLRIRTAFERIEKGGADEEDFNRVAVAFNIAKVRALEIDESLADDLELTQDAMIRCKEQHQREGFFGMGVIDAGHCRQGLLIHEAILQASSPQQMKLAMDVMKTAIQRQTEQGKRLESQLFLKKDDQ